MAEVNNDIESVKKSISENGNSKEGKQTIEELTKRYSQLHTKKIQAETNLENAEKELARLKEKALAEYGTDNIEELKQKLKVMEEENESKRAEYQCSLDKIEADLNEVEKKYSEVKDVKDK